MIGKSLGRYQIVAKLGVKAEWARSTVRATQSSIARSRSKSCPSRSRTIRNASRAFEREAKMLAALNHPNIATIHGFEDAQGIKVLVMELVEGQPLPTGSPSRRFRSRTPCRSRGKSPRPSRPPTNRASCIAT